MASCLGKRAAPWIGRRAPLAILLPGLVLGCTPTPGGQSYEGYAPLSEPAGLGKADGIPPSFDPAWIVDEWLFTDSESIDAQDVQRFVAEPVAGGPASWLADLEIQGRPFAEALTAAAREVDVNPLMLLVRMQVEQGLIRRTSTPGTATLECAFGCGCDCSEVSDCDNYASFERQLRCVIATHRRWHEASMAGTGHWRAGHARTSEDGVRVTPRNHATAALYAYTPWVLDPDNAARVGREPGGNYAIWMVTRQYYQRFLDLGVEFGTGGAEWAPSEGTAFIGDACDVHGDCDYPNGWCHPRGFCSMRCAGLCPEAAEIGLDSVGRPGTFCIPRPDARTTYGMCVPKAHASNDHCSALPGTFRVESDRWLGENTSLEITSAEVCFPEFRPDRVEP